MSKNIIVRTDSSNIIGTGHLYRCLNLVDYYPQHNFYFICKMFPYNASNLVKERGYKLYYIEGVDKELELDHNSWLGEEWQSDLDKTVKQIELIKKENNINIIDYLIVDHYGIKYEWEKNASKYVDKLFVIDDHLERKHYCHFYLNQQYEPTDKNLEIIKKFVGTEAKLYLGVNYLTVNKLFYQAAKEKKFNNKVKRINIYFGGGDHLGLTYKLCKHLISNNKYSNIQFDVIIGNCNSMKKEIIELLTNNNNFTYYPPLSYPKLIDLYLKTDLAIGAMGTSCYERFILKIPTIAIYTAENQNCMKNKFNDLITSVSNLNDIINNLNNLLLV